MVFKRNASQTLLMSSFIWESFLFIAKQTHFFSYIKNLNKLEMAASEKTCSCLQKSAAICMYAVCSCILTILLFTVGFLVFTFKVGNNEMNVSAALSILNNSPFSLQSHTSWSVSNFDSCHCKLGIFRSYGFCASPPLLGSKSRLWTCTLVPTFSTVEMNCERKSDVDTIHSEGRVQLSRTAFTLLPK